MRPFCWVAHAGTSSTKGIYCLPASTPDRIQDVETPQRWLPEQQPQLETRLPLAPSKAPDGFWYAEVLNLQRPQLSVPQDLGLYLRLTNI